MEVCKVCKSPNRNGYTKRNTHTTNPSQLRILKTNTIHSFGDYLRTLWLVEFAKDQAHKLAAWVGGVKPAWLVSKTGLASECVRTGWVAGGIATI